MVTRKRKDLLILIPAYNEEQNISEVLDHLHEEVSDLADILVVNDASADNTNWIAKRDANFLVTHVFNLGYAGALQLGYKYAIRRNYRYVIQMDADGQHDISNIPKLYRELNTPDETGRYPDIVLGSRFMEGSTDYPVSAVKGFAIRYFRLLIRLGTGRRFADPTTGLQGLSRDAVLYYSRYKNYHEKYPDANMILQMVYRGFQIREIPASMHPRYVGTSMHSGLKPVLYMLRMTLSIFAVNCRDRGAWKKARRERETVSRGS